MQDKGEADLLPTTIDSYTRQNRYEEAENGILESIKSQRSMLNGFPAVNHGVSGCRQVIESLDIPVQVRHGTPDARLLTEIAYAGALPAMRAAAFRTTCPMPKTCPWSAPSATGSMSTA